jgi:carbon monoxide dehydrogenase subunit G
MEFGGRYAIAAPRLAVWSALNDTGVLAAAIPGCDRIGWTSETTLSLDIRVNLGLIKPVFSGDLTLSDIHPAEHYRLSGKGRGGLLGLAEGAADITLSDLPEGTLLSFVASGGASGQIMKLGGAAIGNSAQKVIDGFFARFAKAMGAGITALGPPEASA